MADDRITLDVLGGRFKCSVCGDVVGPNPRLEQWLCRRRGNIPAVRQYRRALLCWVCARLEASVEEETQEVRTYIGESFLDVE